MALFSTTRPFTSILYQLLISTTIISSVYAQVAPIRVDDNSADIAYRPAPDSAVPERWIGFSPSNTACPPGVDPCFTSSINPQRLSQGTWHQAHGIASATYKFTGSGVAVHLAFNNAPGAVLDLSFIVDGRETKHTKTGTGINDENGWIYDYVPFSEQSLPNAEHTLVVSQSSVNSVVLIDYIEVTGGSQPPASGSSSSASAPASTTQSSATMVPVVSSAPPSTKTTTVAPIVSTVFVTYGSTTSAEITTITPSSTSGTSPTSLTTPEASESRPFPLVPVLVASSGIVVAALAILALVLCLRRRKAYKGHKARGSSSFDNEYGSPRANFVNTMPVSAYSDSPLQRSISPVPAAYAPVGSQVYANGMATRSQASLTAQIERQLGTSNNYIIANSALTPLSTGLSPRPAHKYASSVSSSSEFPMTARPYSTSTVGGSQLLGQRFDMVQSAHDTPVPHNPFGSQATRSVVPSVFGGSTRSDSDDSHFSENSRDNMVPKKPTYKPGDAGYI